MMHILFDRFHSHSQNSIKSIYVSIWFLVAAMHLVCEAAPISVDTSNFIDTSYYSPLLNRRAEYTMVIPSDYYKKKAAGHRYPVLYLVHCAGCDHHSFIESYHLVEFIDSVDMIVMMPFDGTSGGWWLDSPIDTLSQLSTWLSGEFKNLIDSLYPTYPDRNNTGIAGHSMGGFGALYNLGQHPEIYRAAFSAKGLLDMVGNKGAFMASSVLGSIARYPQHYHNVDILENVKWFSGINAAIKSYSGPNDWFQVENQKFDSLLTSHNIPHNYFENDEDHFPMSKESMLGMLQWFDSLFTHEATSTILPGKSIKKARRYNSSAKYVFISDGHSTSTQKSGELFFNLNGTIALEQKIKTMQSGLLISTMGK